MVRRLVYSCCATLIAGGCQSAGMRGANSSPPPLAATGTAQTQPAPRSIPGLSNFAQVSPTLYRGAQPTADGFRSLRSMGIRTVVNLRALHSDADLLAGTGLQCISIPTEPWSIGSGALDRFLKIVDDPANQPVFVHCQHGSDRTGYIVGGYRIRRMGWSIEDAIAELPKFGFHTIWGSIPEKLRQLGRS